MARAAAEPFLTFTDDVDWWDEPDEPTPLAPAPAPVRARPRPRTLAGDLARLRAAAGRSGPKPLALAALLAASVLLALLVRLALPGEDAPAPPAPPREAGGRAPSPAPEPVSALRTLGPGDRGAAVRDLQAALAALGLYRLGTDGSFGEGTGAAVAEFQGQRGLVVDGIAGPSTLTAILAAVVERAGADADAVERGLDDAVRTGRLSRETASGYATIVADSLTALRRLRPGRSATLGSVLHDLAAHADSFDRPRALALFGMLATNRRHLAENAIPAVPRDIEDADGVVYRYFAGHGFQFHPLANFARLNALARDEDREAARRLADALIVRGVPSGRALAWEYYFPFQGPARWTSGLAQAAGAQALARSGALLGDTALVAEARRAFRAIRATLLRELGGGLWIREYGFADTAILNAQLQSIVSLSEYVDVSGDEDAGAVVARMTAAARGLLHEFDTGCWSRYSLDGAPASTSYHRYHVSLLRQLGRRTGDPFWSERAVRWNGYVKAGGCTTT